jgi:predicted component of type VI protein secretion system
MASVSVTFGGEVVGEFPVDKPVVVVGREATCEIHIDNLGVSRTHCQFIKRGQAYVLQDMNSANGTYVNGKRVGEHYLNDGDEILIGKHTLKYSAHGTAQQPAAEQAPGAAGDDLQDALHTYVMDGARIRERLAEMSGPGSEGDPAPAKPPGTSRFDAAPDSAPKAAKDHAVEFDPLKPQGRPTSVSRPAPTTTGGIKAMLYFSLATNLVLIVLIVLMIVVFMRMTRQQGGGPPPTSPPSAPAAPSASPTP